MFKLECFREETKPSFVAKEMLFVTKEMLFVTKEAKDSPCDELY